MSASAAGTTASLQISDYSTTPTTVYPETTGYAKVTLTNGGTDTATGSSPITTLPPAASGSLSSTPTPVPSASGVTTFSGRDPYCIPQSYVSRQELLHLPVDVTGYYCPGVFVATPTPSVTPTPSGSGTPSSTSSPTVSPSFASSPTVSSATIGGRQTTRSHPREKWSGRILPAAEAWA